MYCYTGERAMTVVASCHVAGSSGNGALGALPQDREHIGEVLRWSAGPVPGGSPCPAPSLAFSNFLR